MMCKKEFKIGQSGEGGIKSHKGDQISQVSDDTGTFF